MKFGTLKNRIVELEANLHIIILSDGRRWIPKSSGIRLSFQIMKFGRDLGRTAQLDDFDPEDQREIRNYAMWNPNPGEHGQISLLTSNQAREIVARSGQLAD
jgi:hypothetical protein